MFETPNAVVHRGNRTQDVDVMKSTFKRIGAKQHRSKYFKCDKCGNEYRLETKARGCCKSENK
jgi:hypothetical protein